ncbi:MAG: hypothetical protein ACRCXM_05795 [Beijerinckiaceae bacterium]
MMMRFLMVWAGLWLTFSPAAGQSISGEELRAEVSGKTVFGVHLHSFMKFSEYHSPDGRIFGHNGGAPVDHGCWDVQGDEVCYYYAGEELPKGTWCWTFDRLANRDQYRLHHANSGTTALAQRVDGNPEKWSDNGKPWQCTPLMSRRGVSARSVAQAGAGRPTAQSFRRAP